MKPNRPRGRRPDHETRRTLRKPGKPEAGRDRTQRPRGEPPAPPPIHLSDEVAAELRATARPGKGEILVKVFADAAAAYAAEDYEEAIRLGEQAKHIALRSASARELLGLAYYQEQRWEDAVRELSAFRRLSGSTAQNPILADCYRARGKPERAIELCDEIDAREVEPEVVFEGAIVAAGALADLRRVDEAIRRLEALELAPAVARDHHLRAWYALGDLLERRGRFTQAREWFEAVAAADPEATDAPARASRLRGR